MRQRFNPTDRKESHGPASPAMVVLAESVTAAPKEYASASTEPLPETRLAAASGGAVLRREAMKLLRDEVGFKDAARMKKDSAFDAI